MNNKISMQRIADHVGVSKFAVSKALSGKPGVSPQTRDKIIQAATQLGYFTQKRIRKSSARPGATSIQQRTGSNSTVVVLIPNVRDQNRQSVYWGRIIDGISLSLLQRNLGMMIVTEQAVDSLTPLMNPDSVLGLIGVGMISGQLLLEVRNRGIPFVLVDHEDPLIPTDTIFMNNYECERRMVHYLLGIGHRWLQFAGNLRFSRSFHDRWLGYRSMLEEYRVPLDQDERLLDIEGVDHAEILNSLGPIVRDLAHRKSMPSAIVCANDAIAINLITILTSLGFDVPGQVSVAGFDDIDDAQLSVPALSTVNVNKEAMGRRAVETLLRRIDQAAEPNEKILLEGALVLRESTAPAHA